MVIEAITRTETMATSKVRDGERVIREGVNLDVSYYDVLIFVLFLVKSVELCYNQFKALVK